MNKNGFVISGLVYSILIMFIALIVLFLSLSEGRKMIMDKNKNELIRTLNETDDVRFLSSSFEKDSWDTIKLNVTNNKASEVYKIGDLKKIKLRQPFEGEYFVRIANMSTPEECKKAGFSQTGCGFVVEFLSIIKEVPINSKSTNEGGWPKTELYNLLNKDTNSIYQSLPEDLKQIIIPTNVISGHGSKNKSNFNSTDKLYLLSAKEVYGDNEKHVREDSASITTRQLDYYQFNNAKKSKFWWLRSPNSNSSVNFHLVFNNGQIQDDDAGLQFGVSPAFRL